MRQFFQIVKMDPSSDSNDSDVPLDELLKQGQVWLNLRPRMIIVTNVIQVSSYTLATSKI